jgi:hypothetical protein
MMAQRDAFSPIFALQVMLFTAKISARLIQQHQHFFSVPSLNLKRVLPIQITQVTDQRLHL